MSLFLLIHTILSEKRKRVIKTVYGIIQFRPQFTHSFTPLSSDELEDSLALNLIAEMSGRINATEGRNRRGFA
jgi:hypothetical protein